MLKQYEAVVIGASAGALEALSTILVSLPRSYELPIIAVVHVPSDKDCLLAQLLDAKCEIAVREAEDKESIESGAVYLAPPDYHLLVEENRSFSLSSDEPVWFSRPSIDVLFESAADVYKNRLIGVILTGANCDGAQGLALISGAGGVAVVQKPETAYASTMPKAALGACSSALSLTLTEIGSYLRNGVL